MGGVFARGFLRLGHPVYPVTRNQDLEAAAQEIPAPEAVLIAVGEKDLPQILEKLPDAWREKIVLLQNELLPADFAHLPQATVISVWFEKKPGMDYKVIIPSPCFGPKAALVRDALGHLDIPVRIDTGQRRGAAVRAGGEKPVHSHHQYCRAQDRRQRGRTLVGTRGHRPQGRQRRHRSAGKPHGQDLRP
ncbi:hypothetical protein [Thiolapillus sp.]|nr:hypothetical protein [Thiolapillus sp.]